MQGFIKDGRGILEPLGNLVQVSFPDTPSLVSVQSKAKRVWLCSCSWRQKKASLRFSTLYQSLDGESAKKIVWLGDCWMNVLHSVVNFLQILDCSIVSKPWLFYRKQGGVSCRLIFYKHLFPIESLYMWSNSFLGFLTHGVLPFPYGDGGGF